MTTATGGKSVYGASVGILMLESRFPRIPGDGGHAATWPFTMLYKVIRNATPERVVRQGGQGLLQSFIEGAQELVGMGADGITTNCGFLALYQRELIAACGVPVASSSMMQVPWVQSLLPPGKRVGIVTVSASSLTPQHLEAAGAAFDTPVVGTESGQEFSRVLRLEFDPAVSAAAILSAAAEALQQAEEAADEDPQEIDP